MTKESETQQTRVEMFVTPGTPTEARVDAPGTAQGTQGIQEGGGGLGTPCIQTKMIGLEVVEAKVAVAEVQAEIPGVTAEVAEVHAEIQGVTAEATAAAAQAVDPTEAEAGPRVEGAARVELEDGGNATWSPGHLLHSAARRFEVTAVRESTT
ncbi:hypothetical protein CYMTET_46989 [Cymbomonas tetramitiformis]|uniref:Uncharacterized protein n=1 Tax=Cymbomonas tetramitiformis TaxID=36881 RepID=A0AAE0EWF0_9CHLO|nr:hypothetical protein CYMTET_46989 [Cymbomonas tetramitiformis]